MPIDFSGHTIAVVLDDDTVDMKSAVEHAEGQPLIATSTSPNTLDVLVDSMKTGSVDLLLFLTPRSVASLFHHASSDGDADLFMNAIRHTVIGSTGGETTGELAKHSVSADFESDKMNALDPKHASDRIVASFSTEIAHS